MHFRTSTHQPFFPPPSPGHAEYFGKNRPFSPIEYKVNYYNNTSQPIAVGWRNGLKFLVYPERSLQQNDFIVRITIQIRSLKVKTDIRDVLSVVDENSSRELQLLKQQLANQLETSHGGATLALDYRFTLDQLREFGGTVYLHEVDQLISIGSLEELCPHPFSEEGRHLALLDVDEGENSQYGLSYGVKIVDNQARYGDRFMNVGGKVFRIAPVQDSSQRCGIYVTSNSLAVAGETENTSELVRRYDFEQEQQIGLYRSIEQALALGDLATTRKEELAKAEHNLAQTRLEMQTAKLRHDEEMHEKEVELTRLQKEIDREKKLNELLQQERERQQMVAKDYYEERSHARKDASEGLKVLPAVIVGIGALIALVAKFT